jgi:pyridoxal 5'-phosphate synthase pdxS subunit
LYQLLWTAIGKDVRMTRENINQGFAEMFKNGVIMDVTNAEQARIAQEAGACSVMALERVPSDIRSDGQVARMSDPAMIQAIMDTVSIPVMAKVRIGHFMEAEILQAMGVDFVDESEVLTPADEVRHVDKSNFEVPFVCGARNLGEALRRINEGAAMIRTKGEAGTGNIVNAVTHTRAIVEQIEALKGMDDHQLTMAAGEMRVPVPLVKETRDLGRLPVVNFAAGGIATPADAALMMALGSDGVFVGSGIFKSENPPQMAHAIVQAVIHYQNPTKLVEISKGLGTAMIGIENDALDVKMAERGV